MTRGAAARPSTSQPSMRTMNCAATASPDGSGSSFAGRTPSTVATRGLSASPGGSGERPCDASLVPRHAAPRPVLLHRLPAPRSRTRTPGVGSRRIQDAGVAQGNPATVRVRPALGGAVRRGVQPRHHMKERSSACRSSAIRTCEAARCDSFATTACRRTCSETRRAQPPARSSPTLGLMMPPELRPGVNRRRRHELRLALAADPMTRPFRRGGLLRNARAVLANRRIDDRAALDCDLPVRPRHHPPPLGARHPRELRCRLVVADHGWTVQQGRVESLEISVFPSPSSALRSHVWSTSCGEALPGSVVQSQMQR